MGVRAIESPLRARVFHFVGIAFGSVLVPIFGEPCHKRRYCGRWCGWDGRAPRHLTTVPCHPERKPILLWAEVEGSPCDGKEFDKTLFK